MDLERRGGGLELLELLEGREVQSIHLKEGRFDELFRNLTQGVSA